MSYFDEADPARIEREYPYRPDALKEFSASLSEARLNGLREQRLQRVLDRAWAVPFYRERFEAHGIDRDRVRNLDDLPRLPAYTKRDLMASVEAHPPWGNFHGSEHDGPPSLHTIFHTTSGTTGAPQPIYYGAFDREVQNALLARTYLMQGLRDEDVVHSVYGFGTVNGGHYVREAVTHFTRARLISAGTGIETPSAQQVALMQRFGATFLVGFGDYLSRLAHAAVEAGLTPGRDIGLRVISGHIDHRSRGMLEQDWGGALAYDWYGVGDTGVIAAQGPDREGLYLYEDAHVVEVIDPDTGEPVADGQPGNLCVTVLFKDTVYPVIRFDTQDVVRVLPGRGPALPAFRRIGGFEGRSDNMVKLRGINVYPTAVGAWLSSAPEFTGEYVCRLRRNDGRDELTVVAEWAGDVRQAAAARAEAEGGLRSHLGVGVAVDVVGPGETRRLTGIEQRQKPIRLIDER